MPARLKAFFNPPNPNPLRAPARIFWTGFLIRVLYMTLAHTYRFRVLDNHFEFGWEMGRIARSLATGHGFASPFNGNSGPSAWTPPLYPLIIALAFKLFGVYSLKAAWAILTVNSILSAATAPAIYQIAWRCFGRTSAQPSANSLSGANPGQNPDALSIALWSAWVWALYPAAMQYAVRWVWDMSLTCFLFTWALVIALRLRGVGERFEVQGSRFEGKLWLAFGALWGLIALSNSSLLAFLPACGLWIIWPAFVAQSEKPGAPFMARSDTSGVKPAPDAHSNPGAPFMARSDMSGVKPPRLAAALLGATLSAVTFLAVISPWVIRNWEVFHAFVPMRSNFGAELYEATIFSNDGFPWMATLPMAETAPEFRRYERLGEIEYSRQQGEVAKAKIRAHPDLFAKNALRRVYFFWISVPHPYDERLGSILTEAIRRINFSFFSIAAFLGLALALRRHIPGAWLFLWAFLIVPFLYYFVTVQARFRHPLEPLICILSVYLFQSADRTRTLSRGKAIAP